MDFVPFEHATFRESVEVWRKKAEKAAVDYGFHMNLTRFNAQVAAQIPRLPDLGITSLKVFSAYNGRLRISDDSIEQALLQAHQHGLLVMAHCEDGDEIETLTAAALQEGHTSPVWHARTRPAGGAVEATRRLCALASRAEAPIYIVHMNAGGEADVLKAARRLGQPVMGETCPQYLFFTEADLERRDGAKWICSPPVRTRADIDRLWQGLEEGDIQVLATDHCAFFYNGDRSIEYEGKRVAIPGKELGVEDFTRIPNGLPGVGDRLPVLWTHGVGEGRITPSQFVALTATNPARIFGLYPRKGALLPGSDADLVLWDPNRSVRYGLRYSRHRTDYNLYEGWELTGMPFKVFLRGRLIVDGDRWLGSAGMGTYLSRQPGAPVL
jgi:dihydropyrimidinase